MACVVRRGNSHGPVGGTQEEAPDCRCWLGFCTGRDEANLTQKRTVVLNSKRFLGARFTNNTAEMSAWIEVCWFLFVIHTLHSRCLNKRRRMAMRTGDKVIVRPDSKYAMGVAQEMAPSEWDAEELANALEECDMNQSIPVHDVLGAHLQRLMQLERQKRREVEAECTVHPVLVPYPRPACTLEDIILAVAEAGQKYSKRNIVRPLRIPPEDEDMVLSREMARRRRVSADSLERVDICDAVHHTQRRVKQRELEHQAERTVESAR